MSMLERTCFRKSFNAGKRREKLSFDAWMVEVDRELYVLCGMPSIFLQDYGYLRDYQSGVKPLSCAKRAIRWAKSF